MSQFDFLSHRRRRRRPPVASAFFAPSDLPLPCLLSSLHSLAGDIISSAASAASSSSRPLPFLSSISRSFLRKLSILRPLFSILLPANEYRLPESARLCFREFFVLLHRAKLLLDYSARCSRFYFVIKSARFAVDFHDVHHDIVILLDVLLAIRTIRLPPDLREQLNLLRSQCLRSSPTICPSDPLNDSLRAEVFALLGAFASGELPASGKVKFLFENMKISNSRACQGEIDFLEEQIGNQEEEPDLPLLGSVLAVVRYGRFLLFGFDEVSEFVRLASVGGQSLNLKSRSINSTTSFAVGDGAEGEYSSITVPRDFCCPISLDLMRDPVVVSTGQTYDRSSILQWMEEGHRNCPNSGQLLVENWLIPNRALSSMIAQWCAAHGFPYDLSDSYERSAASLAAACSSRAAIEANKWTAQILVEQLNERSSHATAVAAHELRVLAKASKMNRAIIARLGAIPLLTRLLPSSNPVVQENAVTALLNLSIHEKNKALIMAEEGCFKQIISVMRCGYTTEAQENAAAALFSLSVVHDYKMTIMHEDGAVEALANLLKKGTPRGKKDAVMALFNLSTHPDSWQRMLDSGAAAALASALTNEMVAEEAAGALALLMKQKVIAFEVGSTPHVITNLMNLMRSGTAKGKENAVAALYEICRRGGSALARRVAMAPMLGVMINGILLSGTKRAKKKAASLMRMCQRGYASQFARTDGREPEHASVVSGAPRQSSSSHDAALEATSSTISIPVPLL